MRVLNRSQTTGETKCVIFRCINISNDAQITLQAVLDRNNIPLNKKTAKLLNVSISDLMNCYGATIESSERIEIAQNEREICIVFQIVNNEYDDDDDDEGTEFFPIQFHPKCRDLEYELEFEHSSSPNNSCLKSVKHRLDGMVLFRGIYDDGKQVGLIGNAVNEPIEIYSEIIDDVTHNIMLLLMLKIYHLHNKH